MMAVSLSDQLPATCPCWLAEVAARRAIALGLQGENEQWREAVAALGRLGRVFYEQLNLFGEAPALPDECSPNQF